MAKAYYDKLIPVGVLKFGLGTEVRPKAREDENLQPMSEPFAS